MDIASNIIGCGNSGECVADKYVDIHCHCLGGLDDGPVTMQESITLCRALVEDNVAAVIATPHQLGRFNNENEASKVRNEVLAINEALQNSDIELTVLPGGDVRVDERICQLLESDRILTLADGHKYILLELPHQVFIDIEPLLDDLGSMGIKSIISHPERHPFLAQQPATLLRWMEHSAYLQITAASLLGEFGTGAQRAAWYFLESGCVSLVATDSHGSKDRRPRMSAAFRQISDYLGPSIAQTVCIENPLKVLNGSDIDSVPLYNYREVCNVE